MNPLREKFRLEAQDRWTSQHITDSAMRLAFQEGAEFGFRYAIHILSSQTEDCDPSYAECWADWLEQKIDEESEC